MPTPVTQTSLATWNRISLEVASRAFSYAQTGGAAEQSAARSGYLKFSHLLRLNAEPAAPSGAWWWIFTPLLQPLLAGANSPAILVALGHHTWRGPGRDDYKREWLGFLAEDMELPDRREALLDICNFTGLHNSIGSFAQKEVMLTSALLEHLNKPPVGLSSMAGVAPGPVLQPLLCGFTHSEPATEDWPIIRVNWSPLWQFDSGIRPKEFEALRRIYPITKDQLNRSLEEPDYVTPRIPSSFLGASHAVGAEFHRQYQSILDRRAKELLAKEAAGKLSLGDLIFGKLESTRSLAHWSSALPEDTKRRLLNTILWFRDFAGDPHAEGKPKMAHLLSSPVWLPANVPDVATISLIAYLRDDSDPAACAAIVNAFRSGSSVVIRNTGIATGFARAEVSFGHELDLLLGAVEKEIQSQSGKISFAYLTMFRRILGLRPEEPMPGTLAALFTKEKLGEAVFRLAFPRASDRNWIPETLALAPWTPDELWAARDEWIRYELELPPWLKPENLRGREFTSKHAYVAFWVLFLLVASQGHSIDHAFPMNVRDRWDGTALGDERAQLILRTIKTDSGWDLLIENLGSRRSRPLDVVRCNTQRIIELFSERVIGDWFIQMSPFVEIASAGSSAAKWQASIRISVKS